MTESPETVVVEQPNPTPAPAPASTEIPPAWQTCLHRFDLDGAAIAKRPMPVKCLGACGETFRAFYYRHTRVNGTVAQGITVETWRLAETAKKKSLGEGSCAGKQPDPSLARSRLKRNGLNAGAVAPEFRLPRLDGGELSLAEIRGRRVLLVFSDPNCGPCDALAPRLEALHREQRPDLQVLVISRRDPEANRAKAEKLGLTFTIVLQKSWEISRDYGMFSTPIGYLIDEQGVLLSGVAVGGDAIMGLADQGAN